MHLNDDVEHQRQPKAHDLLEHCAEAEEKADRNIAVLCVESEAPAAAVQSPDKEPHSDGGAVLQPQLEGKGLLERVAHVGETAQFTNHMVFIYH